MKKLITFFVLLIAGSVFAESMFDTAVLSNRVREEVDKAVAPIVSILGAGMSGNIEFSGEKPGIISFGLQTSIVSVPKITTSAIISNALAQETYIPVIPVPLFYVSLGILPIELEPFARFFYLPLKSLGAGFDLYIIGGGVKYRILKGGFPIPAIKVIGAYHYFGIQGLDPKTSPFNYTGTHNCNLEVIASAGFPVVPISLYFCAGATYTYLGLEIKAIDYKGYSKFAIKAKVGGTISPFPFFVLNLAYNFLPLDVYEIGLNFRF